MGRDVLRKSRGGLRSAVSVFFDRCNLLDSLYALMKFCDLTLPAELRDIEANSLVAMERWCALLVWRKYRRSQWC
jgi:hypothetical protein